MTLQLDELIYWENRPDSGNMFCYSMLCAQYKMQQGNWENRPDSGNMFCYSMLCAQYKMQQGTSLIKYVSCSNQFELTLNSLQ